MSAPETDIRTAEELFVYHLQAVYDMELKLVDALDEMSRSATNDNLSKGFAIHRTETKTQVRGVEKAFEALGRELRRRDDDVVDGLLADRKRFDDAVTDDGLRNSRYLWTAIRTERLEITSYEELLATGEKAGLGADVMDPLKGNLLQEEKTLRQLEGLATDADLRTLWERLIGL
ncbi:ferritin-like domain-containing protein (plasmid) [Haloferacaceae archaeon DSL9]